MQFTTLRNNRGFTLLETLVVIAITCVLMAVAAPMMGNALGMYRLGGDAKGLENTLNVAKMRAASDFTQVRIYIDTTAQSYRLQSFTKLPAPGVWTTEGGATTLSGVDVFGFGALAAAPPNTQAAITLGVTGSVQCKDPATGNNIGNTVCILFNSRGIPIDTTGAPTGAGALYMTDGTAVFGITISATGNISTWKSSAGAAAWIQQ